MSASISHRSFQPPDRLDGATAFSADRDVSGALAVVRLLKTQRWLWRDLARGLDLEVNWGRQRERGHWELAAVAFVVSGVLDIQPWYDNTTDELWRECGFAARPSYRTVWRRLRELEAHPQPWIDAVARLVAQARRHEPRVGAHVHFDATEDETHAAAYHDCGPGDDCAVRGLARGARGRQPAGRGRRAQPVQTSQARADRQRVNAGPPPAGDHDPQIAAEQQIVWRNGKAVKRYRQGGCWFVCRDVNAGVRAYTGPRGARRVWLGYYNQKAIDHFTGGVLCQTVANAARQEYDLFAQTYDTACAVIGAPPQSAIGDKGLSIARVFERCTRNGTAAIFPWRPGNFQRERQDCETHDRHGIARCQHCGGPTEHVRFSAAGTTPRIWARCMIGATPDCAREFTIPCSRDWRLLIRLPRTHPLYHELKHSHESFEAGHDWHRDRYKVAADTLANRPKVCSMGFHQLRANIACVLDWLRICHREGWLGSARRNHRGTRRRGTRGGVAAAHTLARARARAGLAAPYGPMAAQLGIGEETPPSRRPRGAPPG